MTDIIITEEYGDMIASAPKGFSVHGCNAQGSMGSGIALSVKTKYPSVYKAYRDAWKQGHRMFRPHDIIGMHLAELEMGTIIPVQVSEDIVFVNAITQRFYRGHKHAPDGITRFVSYDAIEETFAKIDQLPSQYPNIIPVLSMPLIGAGLGGGNWNIIEGIIKETVKNLDIVVWRL